MDLRTRAERQAFSLEKHYLGGLCIRGHDAGGGKSWRHHGHRNCVECTRERARSWKAENPDRAGASTRRRDAVRAVGNRRSIWPIALQIGGARARARQLGVPYDLTADGMKLKWREQDGLCWWTGKPMDFHIGSDRHPFRPSMDRLVPEAGYVLANVVWSSNFANRARGDLPVTEFAQIMRDMGFYAAYKAAGGT